MKDEMEEFERVANLMEMINKNLEGISKMKEQFTEVLNTAKARIDAIEKKIEAGISDERLKTIEKEIEKIEVHIEAKEKEMAKLTSLADNFNKTLQATEIELKSHIEDTEAKIKEIEKDIAKISRENEKTNKFRLALKGFINALLED
jgi:predicted  nucleic acid-binding Zn-ribbon protein